MKRTISTAVLTGLMVFTLSVGMSCTSKSTATPTAIKAEIVGRWSYSFPPGLASTPDFDYDLEGGLIDATTINSANIGGEIYLILSFPPRSSRNNSRVFIFDTKDPLSPHLVSSISPEKQESMGVMINSAAVSGHTFYAGLFGDKGLWMVDISDPAHPADLGIAPAGVTSELLISGKYAYASGQLYNGISVNDIFDTQNVKEVARIDLVSRECYIAVSVDLLFVGIGQTLTVYDISTPSSPKQVGACEVDVPKGLVTQLPFPEPGKIHWGNWASILDLQASGNYVYATFGAGQLRVINVSNPASPEEAGSVDLGGFAIKLTRHGNFLYVTTSDIDSQKLQLVILDVSETPSPKVIDTVMTDSQFGFGGASYAYCWAHPQVIGNYVYNAGVNYMDVIKIR